MQKCVALIVAAGKGTRFGAKTPKQYHDIAGEMILRKTVKAFLACDLITAVKVVIHSDNVALYQQATQGLDLLPYCFGGETRQDSVRLGLESLSSFAPDIVLIHDAARPFITATDIEKIIKQVKKGQGAIASCPVTDTIKMANENNKIQKTIPREQLYKAMTPQAFMYNDILSAHRTYKGQALTDDAMVAEKAGISVVLIDTSCKNIKITTMEDLEMAENQQQTSIKSKQAHDIYKVKAGIGFDVHAFTDEKDFCILAGVKIPFSKGLKGHSDADVALHALTDALLGAIGEGDIGLHFSDTDTKWKDADSSIFVKYAVDLIKEKKCIISNIDLTIICEYPKVNKYRQEMMDNLSRLLGIPTADINVKGTTTEHLGFTGRGEGIASQAIATVSFFA